MRLEKVGVHLSVDPPRPTGPFASPIIYVVRNRIVNRFGQFRAISKRSPQGLSWRERTKAELALMEDLEPLLRRRAGQREVSGLKVYETRTEYGA